MRRRVGLIVAVLAAAGLLLAGCTETVSGHAAASNVPRSSASSDSPTSTPTSSAPRTSTPPPAPQLACPHVVDPAARLAYDCISTGMTPGRNSMWPVDVGREVDTHWSMDEGSGQVRGIGPAAAQAKLLTQQMLEQFYGDPQPTSKTVHDADITVGSARGHLVQTLITVNPTYRSQQHLRVKQEQLWLVVVPIGGSRLSAWYVSVPDLQKQLWPTVPNLLKTLHVV
jgi:hypothetical protein